MSDIKYTINYNVLEHILNGVVVEKARLAIKEGLEFIAEDARKNTYTLISENIEVSDVSVAKTGDGFKLRGEVFVDLKKVPYARAVEKGSGLHEPGNPHTIDIDAKDAPALVFWWEKKQTLFVGQHVNHPGVEAVPYLAPALNKNKRRLLSLLKARIENG